MFNNRNFINLIILLIFIFAGCGEPIPIKEMMLAKKAIKRALSVKADKYAPKEIGDSMNTLYTCHDHIKKDELEKAAGTAMESKKLADKAYDIAIPLLAKDTIETAEKSFELATEAFGTNLAKDEYITAKEKIEKANTYFQNKKFYDAYITAVEADRESKNARNIAIGKKDILKGAIGEVKILLQRAKDYKAEKYAVETLKLAEENLKIAEDSYKELKLKKGFSAIEVARINADAAYIDSMEASAKDKIETSEEVVLRAEKSEGAEIAKDELSASRESLENAKQMLSEKRYKESISFSEESVRLATLVLETKKPVAAKGKGIVGTGIKEDADYFFHKVRYREAKKDCLWRIAQKYYKKPLLWKKVYEANRDKIKDPDLILPGWILKVPKLKN